MNSVFWEVETFGGKVVKGEGNLPKWLFISKDDIKNKEDMPKYMAVEFNNQRYAVDLERGTLSYNGLEIDPEEEIKFTEPLRLIYFRRIRETISQIEGDDTLIKVGSSQEVHIGFQTNLNGKNYKRVWTIKPNGEIKINE